MKWVRKEEWREGGGGGGGRVVKRRMEDPESRLGISRKSLSTAAAAAATR